MDISIPMMIDEIIRKRATRLPKLQDICKRMNEVNSVVRRLDSICEDAKGERRGQFAMLFAQSPKLADQLQLVKSRRFHEQYNDMQDRLTQLEERFSRGRINIAFVGRAGNGKSLLMQKISGLKGDVIPSSDGDDCTGAKSIVTNTESGPVCAHIEFYTRQEYVEIINEYLKEIFGVECEPISSVEEIKLLPQRLPAHHANGVRAQVLFEKLENYLYHSEEVIPMLGKKKEVPAEEIEQYVAQRGSNVNRRYYLYLGVKVADIHCPFKYKDCGKIVLVDTIGLGDNVIQLENKMLETIKHDSDAVLLLDRPGARRAHVDATEVGILANIADYVGKDYTKKMLFWVLNKVTAGKDENAGHVDLVLRKLNNLDLAKHSIAQVLPVDCNDEKDVNQNLLPPLLDSLTKNIPELDELLLKQVQDDLGKLYALYHELAASVSEMSTNTGVYMSFEFDDEIEDCSQEMMNRIRELCVSKEYVAQRNEQCEELINAVKERLKNIMTNRPKVEKIRPMLDKGFDDLYKVYADLADEMRIKIIDDFLGVNSVLEKLVLDRKRLLVHCMADDDCGRLGRMISTSPDLPNEWLRELDAKLAKDRTGHYAPIRNALNKIINFDVRMESYLIFPVRNALDDIDASITHIPQLEADMSDKDAAADELADWMESKLSNVRQKIERGLADLYNHPNQAIWTAVKDFLERTTHSVDGVWEVKRIWRRLYQNNVSAIWPDKFETLNAAKGTESLWENLISDLSKYDSEAVFQI